ncbi:hypothetical protein [Pelagibacterium lacus]|uniref:DUF4433 domain-containing protein n=1 Tax=Pelagibacterium lacus TaxID=2282655 RepID=A0A369W0U2_9HYPH|nr:hypothetical protein [Pelagibacterium lacus]RDE07567.1 hypothetical protein DVH29_16060 [Pelagibacterium lacus]
MIEFMHITSLDSALSILRSGHFHPVRGTLADAGLNGLQSGRIGWNEQYFTGIGVRLFFEWSGPVEIGPGSAPNVLFDQMPHRVFVPAGTEQYLRLTGFRAAALTWQQRRFKIPWYCFGPARRERARRRAMVQLQAEIDSIVETKPYISVIP